MTKTRPALRQGRKTYAAKALITAFLCAAVTSCAQVAPKTALDSIRYACELAGAPEGDLDVCADLIRAEAERQARD